MFRYNIQSHVANYIQEMLRSTYIPVVPTINPYFDSEIKTTIKLQDGFSYIEGEHLYSGSTIKKKWEFGQNVPNITANYISTQNYYSTEVHEWLGNYLRSYRDYYGIDLMNFYNCYSGRQISNVGLPVKPRKSSANTTSWWEGAYQDNTKVTCFPIRVGASYNIKIYNTLSGPVKLQPLFFNRGKLLTIQSQKPPQHNFLAQCIDIGYTNLCTYKATIANLVDSELLTEDSTLRLKLIQNQRYLYLFLQVPTTEELQISVIESTGYPKALYSTLLDLPEKIKYNVPFSDKLLEYLTGNVITSVDSIPQNIERVQRVISSEDFKTRFGDKFKDSYSKGVFDEDMRIFLYNTFNKYVDVYGNHIKDFLGYVDKDVEELLWDCAGKDLRKSLLEIGQKL